MKEYLLELPDGRRITAELANGFFTRLRGLLGRDGLASGHGLLIVPCNQIHCFFMRFTIDVIFIGRDGRVLRVCPEMKRGSVSPLVRGAKWALELPSGESAGLSAGAYIGGIPGMHARRD